MVTERDIEIERVELRRWRDELDKQERQMVRGSWRAIVRSHVLLERPVYGVLEKGELKVRKCPGSKTRLSPLV